jgi:hypothetical protein
MLILQGRRRNWLAPALNGARLPFLLFALLLAVAMPSTGSAPTAHADRHDQSFIAGESAYPAAIRTAPVLADLSGWELYLHSTTEELSDYALRPSAGTLSVADDIAACAGMASRSPPTLPLRASYRPQAPPSPV